jgi:Fe-S-cluster containining protein
MTLLEALRLGRTAMGWPIVDRLRLQCRLVEYFLENAVRIPGCPFLEGTLCRVYETRPYGCRAYGLWSGQAHERQARASAAAKKAVHKAWHGLGIELPRQVTHHRPAYCHQVRARMGPPVSDQDLEAIGREVRALSARLGPWDQEFQTHYSGDLGFMLTVALLGMNTALQAKVEVTREILGRGKCGITDQWTGLARATVLGWGDETSATSRNRVQSR